tara:strand:- start:1109 stop:1429 length:321 start_codon:yes stop_codon:yes gene_type:complete
MIGFILDAFTGKGSKSDKFEGSKGIDPKIAGFLEKTKSLAAENRSSVDKLMRPNLKETTFDKDVEKIKNLVQANESLRKHLIKQFEQMGNHRIAMKIEGIGEGDTG